jgi:hypothetical protein
MVRLRTGGSDNRTSFPHCERHIMTQSTLRKVTLQTVANYRQVAEHAVGAYRANGHRLIALVRGNLDRGTTLIAPRVATALTQANVKVSEIAAKGIDGVSAQTERAIELGSARVAARIGRVADFVEGIENRYVATGLQAAARLSLTGAQAALALSEQMAAGADKLAAAVGGRHLRGTTAVVRAKTAVKAARRASAPAKPKAVKRTPAPVRRITAATAKPAVKTRTARRVATGTKRPAAATQS